MKPYSVNSKVDTTADTREFRPSAQGQYYYHTMNLVHCSQALYIKIMNAM